MGWCGSLEWDESGGPGWMVKDYYWEVCLIWLGNLIFSSNCKSYDAYLLLKNENLEKCKGNKFWKSFITLPCNGNHC